MIYTVTFNPAIDYVVCTDEIHAGSVNRSKAEAIYYGGKGLNVSMVLQKLGTESKALGFVAGFTGAAVEKGIQDKGIKTDFVHLENGFTRINVKIKSDKETDINGQGPSISAADLDSFFAKLDCIENGDTLVLAGSIPASVPPDVYEKIMERVSDRKVKVVVDATKELLLNVLKYKPFLVKPNDIELGEMFGVTLTTYEDIEKYARRLKAMGAENVLVSMAEKGALLIDENGITHMCGVCKGKVKNSVGAGDSMVAGFIAGVRGNLFDDSNNGSSYAMYDYALKLGTAAGGATAFSEGLATREDIDKMMEQLIL